MDDRSTSGSKTYVAAAFTNKKQLLVHSKENVDNRNTVKVESINKVNLSDNSEAIYYRETNRKWWSNGMQRY